MIVFQNVFYLEMYQNNIYFFIFLKIIFDISTSKWSKNIKKILIWSKKKNSIFLKNAFKTQKQTELLVYIHGIITVFIVAVKKM